MSEMLSKVGTVHQTNDGWKQTLAVSDRHDVVVTVEGMTAEVTKVVAENITRMVNEAVQG